MSTTLRTFRTFVLLTALARLAPADILGTAESFAVLASSSVSNTASSVISGNLGVWPGTAITGFPPGVVVDGTVHATDVVAMQAQSDANTAFIALASLVPNQDLTGLDLGGLTLTPGVYSFSTSAQLTGTLTLNTLGNPDALFVFQIGSTLTTASSSTVATINGSNDCQIYWQIGSSATLGTGTSFQGNILALASITLTTGSRVVSGRALALTGAVTLDNVDVTAACTCILVPASQDCNTNSVPDECDIAGGGSLDCNQNGIPDECEPPGAFPHFQTCDPSPNASVGSTLTFEVCATTGTPGVPVTLTLFNSLPLGATLTPPLPLTGDTVCTTFSWTPMLGQVGGHVLEFFATDANGCTDGCKMRILATETLLLFGPGPGVSQHTAFGRLYDTQLVSVRRAFPVSTTSGPSPLYSVLPPSYSAQIVRYNAAQYPSQPHRWSRAMTFTKDLPSQAMQAQYFGTENGISLGVQTFTDANGLLRVRFPFSAP